MFKKTLIFLLSGFITLAPVTAYGQTDPPQLLGPSAILMDAATGEILYEKNSRERMYPASITKLMTALLAVENTKMEDVITFSHDAVFSIEQGSSHIAIDEGEQITMEEAYYGLFLRSANEVCNGIAEFVDGSMDAFAAHMTSRAKELGAEDTNFVNANGLHDENHYTTAYDMALIAREVNKHQELMDIMGTTYYQMQPTNKQSEIRYLYAQTQMIKQSSIYYYEYCLGGKTGYTTQSSNTLVTYAEKDGTRLICVVMKEDGANAYIDSIALFEYGFENFSSVTAFKASDFTITLPAVQKYNEETLDLGQVSIKAETDISALVPKGTDLSAVRQDASYPESITAPASAGDKIGEMNLYLGDTLLGSSNLVLTEDVTATPESELEAQKRQAITGVLFTIGKVVLGLVIVAAAILFALLYRNELQRKKRWEENYRKRYFEKYGYEPKRIPKPRKKKKKQS